MKEPYGYDVPGGFIGYVKKYDKLILFANYRDYIDYITDWMGDWCIVSKDF